MWGAVLACLKPCVTSTKICLTSLPRKVKLCSAAADSGMGMLWSSCEGGMLSQPPKTPHVPLCHFQLCSISPAVYLLPPAPSSPDHSVFPLVFTQNWGSFPSGVLWNKPSALCAKWKHKKRKFYARGKCLNRIQVGLS